MGCADTGILEVNVCHGRLRRRSLRVPLFVVAGYCQKYRRGRRSKQESDRSRYETHARRPPKMNLQVRISVQRFTAALL